VISSTGVTGSPAVAMTRAVLPVETISTSAACRSRARSSRPVLSYTEMSARRISRRPTSSFTRMPPFFRQ